jgi:imidazolonepropionase-like amidohydrolase
MADVPCPAGATDMDMSGQVVLPGYIDAHAHWTGTTLLFIIIF